MYRRERARDRSARNDGLCSRAFRHHDGTAGQDIGSNDMYWEFRILQIAVAEILVHELAQCIRCDEEVAPDTKSPLSSSTTTGTRHSGAIRARSHPVAGSLQSWGCPHSRHHSARRRLSRRPYRRQCRGSPANAACRREWHQSCRRPRTQMRFSIARHGWTRDAGSCSDVSLHAVRPRSPLRRDDSCVAPILRPNSTP